MLCHDNTVIYIFTLYSMHVQVFLLYVIHLKFVDISVFCFETTRVVRHTQYGDVRGKITSRLLGNTVEEFLGVPYAASPVGNLRFKVGMLWNRIFHLRSGAVVAVIVW
jgi:hypothetical protein